TGAAALVPAALIVTALVVAALAVIAVSVRVAVGVPVPVRRSVCLSRHGADRPGHRHRQRERREHGQRTVRQEARMTVFHTKGSSRVLYSGVNRRRRPGAEQYRTYMGSGEG